MKLSELFTKTSKTVPADETSKNAQLLIQAGFIYKEMAGVYTYLPLGLRVLENISNIVREEMNSVGGQEIRLSALQRKDIWEITGRWSDAVIDVWFKSKLANNTEVGLGSTHEEPIVHLLTEYINSYKDLPLLAYQIQNKFRNELRSKSGIMRGREFLMKDMYSFARTQAEHDQLYKQIKESYKRIFKQLGIGEETFVTFASGGSFSKFSDEFQTLTDAGEDTIYLNRQKKLAVNEEVYTDEILKELELDKQHFEKVKGAEVGNIFSLGTKYTAPLGLRYIDEHGKEMPVIMGCYGIGISRTMGVIAELLSDPKGLVWPEAVAPALVYIAQLGSDTAVIEQASQLYKSLTEAGIAVLYDDRDIRAGEKFADADLMGIPYRIVVSEKTSHEAVYELKPRTNDKTETLKLDGILKALRK